ncbi:M23 family metallopeptidase [Arthrobacter sp. NamB2]|uniref:M23 family metallopeptidase n=1 Tax=Arthrobacter sp. NamB2 TaxID=2576035 RepID=UPI001CB8DF0E|nr:M23 family metallopeptidase [Arthrobacter sp. NamB2]
MQGRIVGPSRLRMNASLAMVVCLIGFHGVAPQCWNPESVSSGHADVAGSLSARGDALVPTGTVGPSLLVPSGALDALDATAPGRRASARETGKDDAAISAAAASTTRRPPAGTLFAPLDALTPTSSFGLRTSPITGEAGEFHTGQDYAAPCGTPVFAADAGTVRAVGWHLWGGGNRVEVDHGNGLITSYNHLQRISVGVGESVDGGDPIAEVGTSGSSTGCHLHFETILNGEHVDPLRWKLIAAEHGERTGELRDYTPGASNGGDVPAWAQSSTRSAASAQAEESDVPPRVPDLPDELDVPEKPSGDGIATAPVPSPPAPAGTPGVTPPPSTTPGVAQAPQPPAPGAVPPASPEAPAPASETPGATPPGPEVPAPASETPPRAPDELPAPPPSPEAPIPPTQAPPRAPGESLAPPTDTPPSPEAPTTPGPESSCGTDATAGDTAADTAAGTAADAAAEAETDTDATASTTPGPGDPGILTPAPPSPEDGEHAPAVPGVPAEAPQQQVVSVPPPAPNALPTDAGPGAASNDAAGRPSTVPAADSAPGNDVDPASAAPGNDVEPADTPCGDPEDPDGPGDPDDWEDPEGPNDSDSPDEPGDADRGADGPAAPGSAPAPGSGSEQEGAPSPGEPAVLSREQG